MFAPGIPLLSRGALGCREVQTHPKNSDGGEQSRSRAVTPSSVTRAYSSVTRILPIIRLQRGNAAKLQRGNAATVV